MDKELKIQKFRELVEEWVQYLDLWEKVKVEETSKTTTNVPYVEKYIDNYGIEKEKLKYNIVKTPPTSHILVTYYDAKGKWKDILHPTGYESREFPYEDLDKRIEHYKYKLKNKQKSL